MTISQDLGAFVASLTADAIPEPVMESTRRALLNACGIALGCFTTPYAGVARAAALAADGEVAGGATLLGDGRRTTIGGATLANAALFHGRAQEDTLGGAHIGTVVIPLLIALFEAHRLPPARLLPSILAAYEVAGRLEQVYAPVTTPIGFRGTPLYGTIGAAAAVARALELPPERAGAAIAIAASLTGGTLQSFGDGTDEWRYQPGIAARTGWMAAELAAAGAVASPNAFEGKAGFARVYGGQDADAAALVAPLGRSWSILRNAFKRYPVCAYNQTLVSTALALRPVAVADIADVEVRMNPFELGLPGMLYRGPFQFVGQTLMSVAFGAAATLLHGIPTLAVMSAFDDAAVQALIEKITVVPDETVETFSCSVMLGLADGTMRSHTIRARGEDMNLDRTALLDVLVRVAGEGGIGRQPVERLDRLVFKIEHHSDLSALVQIFAEAAAIHQPRSRIV